MVIRARAALVEARTMLVNSARGLTKSYGERLRGCNARGMNPKAAQDLSPGVEVCAGTDDARIESASERIREYDQMLESMLRNRYPEAERLKQIMGVGTLIAHLHADAGRSKPFPQEPGCSLLRGPTWKTQLGTERTADAHQ